MQHRVALAEDYLKQKASTGEQGPAADAQGRVLGSDAAKAAGGSEPQPPPAASRGTAPES